MNTEPVHIGFDNIIAMNRVVVMLSPRQQPIKRLIQKAKAQGLLIDATHARKARTVIVLDSGHIVLSTLSPDAIVGRLAASREEADPKPGVNEGKNEL